MSTWEHNREDMMEPIERLFERTYENKTTVFEDLRASPKTADIAVVTGAKDALHVVRLEESWRDCVVDPNTGMMGVAHAPGNERWIALPMNSFREHESDYQDHLRESCERRGVGIILIRVQGLGLAATIELEPAHVDGEFLESYERVRQAWSAQRASAYDVIKPN